MLKFGILNEIMSLIVVEDEEDLLVDLFNTLAIYCSEDGKYVLEIIAQNQSVMNFVYQSSQILPIKRGASRPIIITGLHTLATKILSNIKNYCKDKGIQYESLFEIQNDIKVNNEIKKDEEEEYSDEDEEILDD